MNNSKNTNRLKNRLLSNENIYFAIYFIDSYLQNKELLADDDLKLLSELHDVFSDKSSIIKTVKDRINKLINDNNEYFNVNVFFKPKKIDNDQLIFRPLHTSKIIDQIAMISMLQVLIYDLDDNKKLLPSNISRLIQNDFYGNRIDYSGNGIFKPWGQQYQEYVTKSNDCMYEYSKSKKYKYEVNLDLINFFPSINPKVLINYLYSLLPKNSTQEEENLYKVLINKLCIFKIEKLNSIEKNWYCYNKEISELTYVKGIPQGLPHSYFFANLYMILIKEKYNQVFPGEMFFYVDDSVIFTNGRNGIIDNDSFSQDITDLNSSFYAINELYLNKYKIAIPEDYCFDDEDFEIKVHDSNGKSTFYSIENAIEESGELYLHSLSRETSNLGFDLFTNIEDDNLKTIERRTKTILEVVEKELITKKNDPTTSKSYFDKLIRYKKYFKYRSKILEYVNENNISNLHTEFTNLINEIFKIDNIIEQQNVFIPTTTKIGSAFDIIESIAEAFNNYDDESDSKESGIDKREWQKIREKKEAQGLHMGGM